MSIRLILTTILSLALLALFLSLGVWQLKRLAWKEAVLADIENRIAAAPVDLPATPEPESHKYLPVQVAGELAGDELHVLVSTRDLGAGFRIIQALTTSDDRRILLDRGFVPVADKDSQRATGPVTVTGNLHWPDERDGYTPENDPATNYWYAREVDVMAKALGTEPILVIAATRTDPAITPLKVTTEGIPNDHLEYAMTWFLMAAVWVVMTGLAVWRMKRRTT